ncbi:MAG: CpaF family protein [Candidatus Hydrothermarchaeota archaeon]|nr:MAG: CpaF family protein [Candidatus Hydrothermarchaeota archaeon]
MEKIVESGEDYRIVKKNSKYYYVLNIPELSRDEKLFLEEVRRKAITDIRIDPYAVRDEHARRKLLIKEILELINQEEWRWELKEIPLKLEEDKKQQIANIIVDHMIGYGYLDPLIKNDDLEEIMVLGVGPPVYVYHRKYGMCESNIIFERESEIKVIIEKIARLVGRRIDISVPLLDARLPDGSRVNATLPPVTLDGPTITIRKFKKEPYTIIDLINFNTLSSEIASFLWLATEGLGRKPANILIAGGTGSGKTTTLNCLAIFIPERQRIITIEDTAELQLPLKHKIRMETRPPNVEGKGEITMDMLLKNTLRMRPDRIIVGEVRGEEAKTLFIAMNTGHEGCLGTLHANSAKETITRLVNPPMNVPRIMIPALDLIVVQNRYYTKGGLIRRVNEIAEVYSEGGRIKIDNIYEWNPPKDSFKKSKKESIIIKEISRFSGVPPDEILEEIENRKKLLEYLRNNNIRELTKVHAWIQGYYEEKEKILNKIST